MRAVRLIEEEAAMHSSYLSTEYGRGYIDETVEALSLAWPYYILPIPKITLDGVFIRYLAITLQEESHEKLYKLVKGL
jgi:hypothetical protein